MLVFLLNHDKNYDSLPNFTAADCLRVVGIGRNEYLTISSDLKTSSPKLFFKRNPYYLLPKFPRRIVIEPWWKVEVGYVLESDVQFVSPDELAVLDRLIDYGAQTAGALDYDVVHNLYRKGLIYLDVPISGEDKISIPPLQNFVMNRVSGDYFENLLYNVFVTADEQSTIAEVRFSYAPIIKWYFIISFFLLAIKHSASPPGHGQASNVPFLPFEFRSP